VKGVNRSIICDLQQNSFEFIPNELYFILTKLSKKTMGGIKAYFDHAYDEIVDEYFGFLIQKEFGRWVAYLDKGFVPMNFNYEAPNAITICIIDIDKGSKHPMEKIVAGLDELICQGVQLRCYDLITPLQLEDYLRFFDDSKVRGIEVIVPFEEGFTKETLIDLTEKYPRLVYLVLSNAPENKEESYKNEKFKVNYTTTRIDTASCCGYINSMYFRVNVKAFTEAKNFNSCLHKKISIDKDGNIGNCPSFPKKYGNINDISLAEAITMDGFKKAGSIKKDDINTCRVCEFRYICSDCRAYTENPDDLLSKPLKCGYDPYSNVWEQWSLNPLKQRVMDDYKNKEIIKVFH
jgi:SPASM domain peptide maturase of grasp-with-spasm system